MKNYDVVIIGAGIGGLVCGCYLAKAGKRVLIIEKNTFPGGYCSSFKGKGFVFDSGVHALGGLGSKGVLRKIFEDLGILGNMKIIELETTDVIYLNDLVVHFYKNIYKTIDELKYLFPLNTLEIDNFFNIIFEQNYMNLYHSYKNLTFAQLLDQIFSNDKLKSIFSVLLGNINLPPSMVSSLTAISLYKTFVFEGGYYPAGGMQKIADTLAKCFVEFGGEILYCKLVNSIIIRNGTAIGVGIEGESISSKIVISNSDALNTFTKLLPTNSSSLKFHNSLKRLLISSSNFVVYLGLKRNIRESFFQKSSIWFLTGDCSSRGIEKRYKNTFKKIIDYKQNDFLISFPSFYDENLAPEEHDVGIIIITAPFINIQYWKENKIKYEANLIKRVNRLIPGFENLLVYKDSASPATLYRYTLNSGGAMNGWASIPEQNDPQVVASSTEIINLYLVGHWTTGYFGQGGIPMVAYSGRKVAKSIINFNKIL
jgi:prolycopene isomerase